MPKLDNAPICGICLKEFVQLDDVTWMGMCEHRAGVIARVGTEKVKKASKKKVMTMDEYNNNKEKDEIKTKGKGKGKKKVS